MQIIDEIEPHRRGPYAGAVGYIDFAGNMDTCIALRTIVIQNGTAYVQAGAGIVADSVPEREYEETLNKARGLLKAIEITQQRANCIAKTLGGGHASAFAHSAKGHRATAITPPAAGAAGGDAIGGRLKLALVLTSRPSVSATRGP